MINFCFNMCNICLNKLNKLICPLCRKTINNDITISHSYIPSINYINFNFNEISYDDDQILLNFIVRRYNRVRRHNLASKIRIKYINPFYEQITILSIDKQLDKDIDEHKNDHNKDEDQNQVKDEEVDKEFSFDDIFN